MRLGLNLSVSMGQLVQTLASYVLNFFTETFKADNGANTFAGAVTHSRLGQATMTSGYGPEIVDNGSFDSDVVGWTTSGSTTIEWYDGALRVNQPSGGSWHTNNVTLDGNPLVAGKVYRLTFDARDISTSGGFSLWTNATIIITVAGNSAPPLSSDWNSYSATFTAEPNGSFRIASNNGTGSFELDNISIQEIPSIKWAPHNLLPYSEDFTQSSWFKDTTTVTADSATAPDGTTTADKITVDSASTSFLRDFLQIDAHQYTFGIFAKAGTTSSIQLYIIQQGSTSGTADVNLSTGAVSNVHSAWTGGVTATDVGNGWYFIEGTRTFTNSAHNHGVGVAATGQNGLNFYVWGAHLYRSDLGGMVDNPDRGDSYVPTTSSAVYLPRRGHHIYNGYEWVNEGMLHESEARTNDILYSEDFATLWSKTAATATPTVEATGPDGITSATKLGDSGAGGTGAIYVTYNATVSPSTTYTYSVFAKAGQLSDVLLYQNSFTSPANNGYYFDLLNGTFSAYSGTPPITPTMEDVGNGWYRCSITFTTDAVDTSGNLQIYVADGTGLTLPLDGTSNILIYGAQFEAAPTPSSYIPTSGATVTRAAESLTIPSANLPWPTPKVIGSELVTNGDGSSLLGWSGARSNETVSLVGGRIRATATTAGAYGVVQALSGLTVGNNYSVQADVLVDGGNDQVYFRVVPSSDLNNTSPVNLSSSSNKSYSIVFAANATTMYIGGINVAPNAGDYFELDNVSVKEIDPLALSIQMKGRATYADDNQIGTVALWSWTNGPNYLRGYIRTDGTKTGMPYVQQNRAGTLDVVNMSDAEQKTPGVFVPFNIAARHGSTFVNAASDGVAQLTNTTPTGLPDIENYNLALGNSFMGTIESFQIWDRDIGDTGIVAESSPDLEPSLSLVFDSSFNSFVVKDWSE